MIRDFLRRYTFLLEYAGGTYLRQVTAKDLPLAFQNWYDLLRTEEVPQDGTAIAVGFAQAAIDEEEPVAATAVLGLVGVWCGTALVGDKTAMVHVVAGDIGATD